MVIVTRNVDLSIGSVLGLSAYSVGMLFRNHPGTPILIAFALGIVDRRGDRRDQRIHHHRVPGARAWW